MRKLRKSHTASENSVEAYTCMCFCSCSCVCHCIAMFGPAHGPTMHRNPSNTTAHNTGNAVGRSIQMGR